MGEPIRLIERLKMAWKVLTDNQFAGKVLDGLKNLDARPAKAVLPPERVHASGLMLLAALQREGRFIDFLQQDASGFSDEDVGAAARVVHDGCRKILNQFFAFEPAVKGDEGMPMTVPAGFDA